MGEDRWGAVGTVKVIKHLVAVTDCYTAVSMAATWLLHGCSMAAPCGCHR